MNANEAIRVLTEAGHAVTRNRKHAPGYKWAHDYKINGVDVTLGRLRRDAESVLRNSLLINVREAGV